MAITFGALKKRLKEEPTAQPAPPALREKKRIGGPPREERRSRPTSKEKEEEVRVERTRERPELRELGGRVPGIAYANEWLTEAEEEMLLGVEWPWTELKGRRVHLYDELPSCIADVAENLKLGNGCCCLLNGYEPGQGVLQHTDGPAYESWAAALSLGQDRLLYFCPRLRTEDADRSFRPDVSVLLRRRSVVLFKSDAYDHYTHGLQDHIDHEVVGHTCPCLNLDLASASNGDVLPILHFRLSLTLRRRVDPRDSP